ncbi:hypothetical protein JQ620_09340 [Bradyrhizobium sp. AUGA SZCCT0274]|uniref:hypothetical protein n=1 Tax=Bradyrhizobium sp. AUGA SZCCT0274 TaxID=2807670 RepID=UPI001BA5502B|nr:hypothetical protein [Bradyrhizobium sp. AUGA SZCCT0274]MBR1240328.1 hypothetical protein [Bradyrhizobium sp. AUGA SZCCT0274]
MMAHALPLRKPGAPLGLIPFTVPGWPSDTGYRRILARVAAHQPVSFELALPSGGGWSFRTSGVIAEALGGAVGGLDAFLPVALQHRPNVAVLYRGLLDRTGRKRLLARLNGAVDHVMLEWEPDELSGWIDDCFGAGIGLVRVMEAGAVTDAGARTLSQSALPNTIVYLKCAARTAGVSCGVEIVRTASARIKEVRPDLFVMAGFGIARPEQVRRLAAVRTLDAAAVGTALLERFPDGEDVVDDYFGSLSAAARSAA